MGTGPHLTHSPSPPSQVVSAWLNSHHWTLTWGPEAHRSPMLTRNCLLLFLWILVDEGSVSSLRPPSPPLGRSRTGREHAKSLVGPMRNGAAGYPTGQKGLVWNQFFVLEEYMGSDPQYVGKLHTDLDSGDSGVKDIHALRSLDREEKPYYTLRAQAVDIDTNRPLEPESEFVIKVQDINDNEPKFLEGPYTASVPEMSPMDFNDFRLRSDEETNQVKVNTSSHCFPPGTYVTQVTATDADDPTYGNSARVVYSILHGQPYFSVDPKTGVIKTALPNMDREVKEQYQVLIQAKDMGGQLGGLAGTTTINITLSDVNDNPPRFSKSFFHLRVPESSAVGSAVGRIKAHDLDIGKNAEVEYTIVPGDGGAMFDITTNEHNQEGIIILKRVDASNAHLDPRFQSFGAFKDTATVKINVLDVDEPPVFNKPSYMMDVYEDTPRGTIIGASDLDSYFDIDPVEGTISTNELLDRESIAQHNISIVATKLNSPVLTSRVAVTVHVLDINEFPPELASPYETFVCENSKAGQVFRRFSAQDQDLRAAGQQFSFKSPKEDMKNKNFTIRDFGNNTAGIVTKRGGFRRRLQEIYLLPVVIDDNGYPPKSSTGTLTIRVCGCESDGSLLTCSAEAIFLPVGLSTGALIAILLCIIILNRGPLRWLETAEEEKTLMSSKEDIRDNVIHYDDEGGGEEDTHAFDMGTLRNPKVVKENLFRRDVKPEMKRGPRAPVSQDSADIRDFINQRLKEHDGDGSVAESLSSIESIVRDPEEDYDYLNDWGPRFKTLAGIFGEQSETQSNSTTTENTH
ncbi:hypothetical protein F7725_028991 [Dissostichus mawsoni]|uniref:Cadherin domain-containing protein n=1 Tax=Dissostichus mawsoni TaxID=36200 RepID=A0A7J5XHX6_DISMA|nr:hypothetical protein F7725_028991 [Dissostichus mawsoni]